jgi:hypothetical protein
LESLPGALFTFKVYGHENDIFHSILADWMASRPFVDSAQLVNIMRDQISARQYEHPGRKTFSDKNLIENVDILGEIIKDYVRDQNRITYHHIPGISTTFKASSQSHRLALKR